MATLFMKAAILVGTVLPMKLFWQIPKLKKYLLKEAVTKYQLIQDIQLNGQQSKILCSVYHPSKIIYYTGYEKVGLNSLEINSHKFYFEIHKIIPCTMHCRKCSETWKLPKSTCQMAWRKWFRRSISVKTCKPSSMGIACSKQWESYYLCLAGRISELFNSCRLPK